MWEKFEEICLLSKNSNLFIKHVRHPWWMISPNYYDIWCSALTIFLGMRIRMRIRKQHSTLHGMNFRNFKKVEKILSGIVMHSAWSVLLKKRKPGGYVTTFILCWVFSKCLKKQNCSVCPEKAFGCKLLWFCCRN